MKVKLIIVVALLVGVLACNSWAATANLLSSGDTDIRNAAADYAKGNRDGMWVYRNWSESIAKAYIKFTLPADFGIASAATFKITSMDVYNPLWNFQYDVYGLKDSASGNDWQALSPGTYTGPPSGGLTWNNAPGNDPNSNGFTSDMVSLGSFTEVGDGVEISFSSAALIDWLNTDTDKVVTLAFRKTTQTSYNSVFESTEGGFAPKLDLTYVPEPATIAILGLGGLMIRRKRRS